MSCFRCYWDTSNLGVLWNTQGKPVQTAVDILSRPYPMAVSGKNLKYSFDPEVKAFDMEYDADPDILAPTLIFVPQHTYGADMEVIVSDDLEYRTSSDNSNILEVRLKTEENSREEKKSWVVIGVSGKIETVRTSTSWLDTFWSFVPFV